MQEVKLQYFKETGKYYSSGTLYVPLEWEMYMIFNYVRERQQRHMLPDLIDNCGDFYVLVSAPRHRNDYPALLIPEPSD